MTPSMQVSGTHPKQQELLETLLFNLSMRVMTASQGHKGEYCPVDA